MFNQEIIEQYENAIESYINLIPKIEGKIKSALIHENIKFHGITHRIKSTDSLAIKLARPDKIYHDLKEITDLLGFRIVTYFEEDIDLIGRIIESVFAVDYDNSIDKRQVLDPRYFGYRSLHYVCSLSEQFEFNFEIQIRTILQHTWAEIEHDLGYKFPESVPAEIRRRFSRLAGLLELADQEFSTIRKEINEYEKKLGQSRELEIPLTDELGLRSIIGNEIICQFEGKLAKHWNQSVLDELFYPPYLIKILSYSGLSSKSKVIRFIEKNENNIINFSSKYSDFTRDAWGFSLGDFPNFKSGYSLFIMAHYKVFTSQKLEINKIETVRRFYENMDYPTNPKEALRIAKLFVEKCV